MAVVTCQPVISCRLEVGVTARLVERAVLDHLVVSGLQFEKVTGNASSGTD